MREKCQRRENSSSEFYYYQKVSPPSRIQDLFGAYIVLHYKQKYKNILNTHLYMKGKMVKCKKWVNRKSKGAKIRMQKAFLQAAKISQPAKFPVGSNFLAFSALLSFWFLTYNVVRLEFFVIGSTQQFLHK